MYLGLYKLEVENAYLICLQISEHKYNSTLEEVFFSQHGINSTNPNWKYPFLSSLLLLHLKDMDFK